eukprot:Unigene5596_Nuclearia_a/m.17107 Unigene5596_Nuclearia_a/g.17107  ORF Unigene5596_Nuclearia_a/g.17107 Unigene5596_Nuclearia_a/m.17107 type:complete len:184 (+) Unigene5596_Nuclearia_a:1-552(+)
MQTSASSSQLPVVAETRLHKRYLALWSRTVRFPDGRDVDWDVVGHMQPNPVFVVVFPFSTARGTTTLVREYAQGPNEFMYTLAAGQYERQAHSSVLDAARCELAEEARLSGGHWEPLLPDGHTGVSELKWSTNKFSPWLCIDPQKDTAQLAERDADGALSAAPLRALFSPPIGAQSCSWRSAK